MIAHTLKVCTGKAGPEQSLVLLSLKIAKTSALLNEQPTKSKRNAGEQTRAIGPLIIASNTVV